MRAFCLGFAVALLVSACGGETDAELVAKAKSQLAQRDFAGAAIHLKNALGKNPASVEARLLLGRTLLGLGDVPTALIELRKALDAKAPEDQVVPDIAKAMLVQGQAQQLIGEFGATVLTDPAAQASLKTLLATAHATQGSVDAAREAVAQALKAQPGNAAALVVGARLDVSTGQVDAAMRVLDGVLAREPGHEDAGLLKGDILLQARQDAEGALVIFRQVRSAHAQSVPAQLAIVSTLLQQNKLADARTDMAALRKLAPKNREVLLLQARLSLAEQDYKGSREITEQLLAADPNNLRVLMVAGGAEMGLNNHTLAAGLFGRAVKAAPRWPAARQMLAQSLLKSGLPDQALEALQPLIDSPQADARSLSLAGEAWLVSGQGAKAEAAFQRALKAGPDDARLRTGMALAQLARGADGPAVAQLESIAQADSGTQADLALISARLRQNDLPAALKAIAALDRKQPNQALPLVLRAQVQLMQGDKAGARASLDAALARQAGNVPAMMTLARLDGQDGKPAQARQRLDALVKAEPQNLQARLALVELDRQLGAPDAALVAQLKDAVRVNPSNPAPHLMLVERLLAGGDGAAALGAAQDASAALPNDLAVMDALGRAQIVGGDSARAVSTFKRLAALQPKNPMPLARLADAHLAGKDKAAAATALRQALAIQPDHLLSQRGLALLALDDKRQPEALAIARSIQKRLPKDPAGFALEGEIEARSGNWAAAATALGQALQRQPAPALAVQQHAALLRAGKAADAERMAAGWMKQHPNDAVFVYHLGDVAAAAKDWPAAEAQYRAVLAQQPRHAAAMNNIAWLMATQRKAGATAMAEQALAILPDRPALLDTLALAQESEGQLAKAVETQKRAVELAPRDASLRLRLAKLHASKGNKADARDLLEPLTRLGPPFQGQAEAQALLKSL